MLIPVSLFILGLLLLIKGGDWFVDGACGIAKRFNIPDVLIGATVVSIGTTLPEVMVSATSAAQGHGQMAYGNAFGSIICNTALIAAITIAIKPAKVNKKTMKVPVVFFFISEALYCAIAYTTGNFSRPVGFLLLGIFVIYMVLCVKDALGQKSTASSGADFGTVPEPEDNAPSGENEEKKKERALWLELVFLVIGAVAIAFGADLLVDNGIIIATGLGVPETVVALTFVALGTSLPELVTAVTSLIKGHGSLSVGNICGANLFNLILVSGVSISIGPFSFENAGFATKQFMGREVFTALLVDTPLSIVVMLIMTLPIFIKGKLEKWQGILLLIIYFAYCTYQFAGV
ncbi:MAG: calcium/sodium antiporter [Lachnospiraceae bacterium]|nr:calcium/sodium antiporter [Lachnospiraceae bacterium]